MYSKYQTNWVQNCKWVYSVKLKPNASLDCYKARLVALGNRQKYGIDYDETSTAVAKMTIVPTVLAIAASQSWPLLRGRKKSLISWQSQRRSLLASSSQIWNFL